ncbi:flagellar protein FliS [Cohaesibacter sp. ES.047]|uniref:flagellar export chaperone FliS n=1 Tax=Cohaesibacter sp. ES.047 TaxID=1798205 RepID=UPI000BB92CB8|nr:flagellar protein FliS [Cohaesibacter sp. ES.047]SNY91755.1 flagellar protein FliS [Cohaesibacter sp. ES.047]
MNPVLNQAIGAYRTATKTVAPTKAVALLLDEVLNSLILTSYYLRGKEFEKAFNRVVHASKILSGLRQNVNLDVDQEMGQQFIDMYSQNIFALHNAYGRPDSLERFSEIAKGLVDFRNSWAEIAGLPLRNIDMVLEEILSQKDVETSPAADRMVG